MCSRSCGSTSGTSAAELTIGDGSHNSQLGTDLTIHNWGRISQFTIGDGALRFARAVRFVACLQRAWSFSVAAAAAAFRVCDVIGLELRFWRVARDGGCGRGFVEREGGVAGF